MSYTPGEDIAHIVTHGLGAALSIAALVVMVIAATVNESVWQVVSAVVFGTALIMLYGVSTAYHALSHTRVGELFHLLDQIAIYLLIVGTYTPFLLVSLRGPWGWSLLAVIWTLAVVGIALRLSAPRLGARLAPALYLIMGWLGLIAIEPLLAALPPAGLTLLLAGGVAYTVGLVFYSWRRLPYHHAIWHVFALAGSAAHFSAVMRYVLIPPA